MVQQRCIVCLFRPRDRLSCLFFVSFVCFLYLLLVVVFLASVLVLFLALRGRRVGRWFQGIGSGVGSCIGLILLLFLARALALVLA